MNRALILVAALLAMSSLLRAQDAVKLPFTLAKETTAVTIPVWPDGTPNYVAALNERCRQGVTPENNAFVLWLQVTGTGPGALDPTIREKVIELCGAKTLPAGAETWPSSPDRGTADTADLQQARRELWTLDMHPDLAKTLQSREKLLGLATQAAARPKWWLPAVSTNGRTISGLDGSRGSLTVLRFACNHLCARATLHARAGDFDGFLTDVQTVKRLARLVNSGAAWVERSLGDMLDRSANDAIGTVVGSGSLTVAQCTSLSAMLDGLAPLATMVECVDTEERWHLLESIVLAATGKTDVLKGNVGNGDAWIAQVLSSVDRQSVDWDVVLKLANQLTDESIARLKTPTLKALKDSRTVVADLRKKWGEQIPSSGENIGSFSRHEGETKEAYTNRLAQSLMVILLHNFEDPEEQHRLALLHNEMLRVLIAAASVRAKTGTWPATLDALVPGAVAEIPKDPYSPDEKTPVKYVVTANHARVSSLARIRTSVGAD